MVSYLGIHSSFPDLADRVKQLVTQDKLHEAETLVAEVPELQIVNATFNQADDLAKKRLSLENWKMTNMTVMQRSSLLDIT